MALDADVKSAVGQRVRNAEEHVASGELAPVQGERFALLDPTRQQFRGTGDAAPVAEPLGAKYGSFPGTFLILDIKIGGL